VSVQLYSLVLGNEDTLLYVRQVCASNAAAVRLAANYFTKFDNVCQFYLITMARAVSTATTATLCLNESDPCLPSE